MAPLAVHPPVQVGIVGGGIGGLAAAIALDQREIEVIVYESAGSYEAAGAGILLAPGALLGLECLGLAGDVRDAGIALNRLRVFDGNGNRLRDLDLGRETKEIGQPYVYLHRATLQQLLLDRFGAHRVQLNRTCESVQPGSRRSGAVVQFKDGFEQVHDVVIGADGIDSTVRTSLWSTARRELGTLTYRGVADRSPEELEAETWQVWAPGTRIGVAPLDGDRTYWFTTMNEPVDSVESEADRKSMLVEHVSQHPAVFERAVEATDASDMLVTSLADLPPLETWHRGRVALLGDAAHAALPYLGQGATQAIGDGLELAKALTEAGADHPSTDRPTGEVIDRALQAYERGRRPRVDRVVRLSRLAGRFAQTESRPASRARNSAIQWAPAALLWYPRRWLAR